MSTKLKVSLSMTIGDLCDQLLNQHKLITTKTVITLLSELYPNEYNCTEDLVTNEINAWRVARLNKQNPQGEQEDPLSLSNANVIKYNKLVEESLKAKKELIHAKREIQFLKGKIQALNSLYNRQRKELIMRIETMLYKNGHLNN